MFQMTLSSREGGDVKGERLVNFAHLINPAEIYPGEGRDLMVKDLPFERLNSLYEFGFHYISNGFEVIYHRFRALTAYLDISEQSTHGYVQEGGQL